MRKSLNKKRTILVLIVPIVILIGIIILNIYRTTYKLILKQEAFTFEYGSTIPDDVGYYFSNLDKGKISVSDIDTDEIGEYNLFYNYGINEYKIPIKIIDNTAPIIKLYNDPIFLVGYDIAPEMLVKSIEDKSSYTLSYSLSKIDSSKVSDITLEVMAVDDYGNTATSSTTIHIVNSNGKPFIDSSISLEENINDYLYLHKLDNFSLSYYNFKTEDSFSIRGDTTYTAASTIKWALAMLYYDYISQGKININTVLTYTNSDYESGAGVLQFDEVGSEYSIDYLLKQLIMQSDNVASNILFRYIYETTGNTGSNILGTTYNINYRSNNRVISSNDALTFIKEFYNNEKQNPYYSTLENSLKNTIFTYRIAQFIPKNLVAHKIGDFDGYTHDIGIVYGEKPFAIAILSNGGTNKQIADLAYICYEYLNLK